jgi:hypothetical protein
MTVYNLDEDQFVDEGEMKTLSWRDRFNDKDHKISKDELAKYYAKQRR